MTIRHAEYLRYGAGSTKRGYDIWLHSGDIRRNSRCLQHGGSAEVLRSWGPRFFNFALRRRSEVRYLKGAIHKTRRNSQIWVYKVRLCYRAPFRGHKAKLQESPYGGPADVLRSPIVGRSPMGAAVESYGGPTMGLKWGPKRSPMRTAAEPYGGPIMGGGAPGPTDAIPTGYLYIQYYYIIKIFLAFC